MERIADVSMMEFRTISNNQLMKPFKQKGQPFSALPLNEL